MEIYNAKLLQKAKLHKQATQNAKQKKQAKCWDLRSLEQILAAVIEQEVNEKRAA